MLPIVSRYKPRYKLATLALFAILLCAPAARSTENDSPIRISGPAAEKLILHKVPPVYPKEARRENLEGTVVLRAVVSKTGAIEDVNVVSGPTLFMTPALDAVRRYFYRPYLLNGTPVRVETTINVEFRISH